MNTTHAAMRTLSLLLALCLLLPTFAACSGGTENPGEKQNETEPQAADPTAAEESGTETPPDEEALGIHVESGLEKVDMGGRQFVFLSTNWYYDGYGWDEIYAEEYTGEPINDGIYDRNLYMEKNFNTSVEIITSPDVYAAAQTFSQSVLAGDHAYDIFMTYLNQYQRDRKSVV